MPQRHVVVDGSNIATEGRTLPSLAQLNEAVQALRNEYPDAEITVVVDATFAHRIDPAEVQAFEAAEAANEIVSPPAGAIGRGDAFLLRIAGKIGAMVLSNDSFQEFHGEHDWLFTEGRLLGGKPVPGIGWIFTPRTPVRGAKSRKAVKEARGRVRAAPSSGETLGPKPVPTKPPPRTKAATAGPAKADGDVALAIADATRESVEGDSSGKRRRRRRRAARPAEPVNDALPFITFIAEHPLGTTVEGEVESFTSHGAFIKAGGARCYIPIVSLGDPPPRAARDVLARGQRRRFVVQALDPQRRGVELALPAFAHVAGQPTEETIAAEIAESTKKAAPAKKAERPAKKAEKAAKKAAKPARGAEPAKAAEKPAAKPAKTAAKPAKKAAKAPAKAIKAPAKAIKVPAKASKASATTTSVSDKPPAAKRGKKLAATKNAAPELGGA